MAPLCGRRAGRPHGPQVLELLVRFGRLCRLLLRRLRYSSATTWIAQVEYFGDLDGAVLLNYVAWWQSGAPLMVRSQARLARQHGVDR